MRPMNTAVPFYCTLDMTSLQTVITGLRAELSTHHGIPIEDVNNINVYHYYSGQRCNYANKPYAKYVQTNQDVKNIAASYKSSTLRPVNLGMTWKKRQMENTIQSSKTNKTQKEKKDSSRNIIMNDDLMQNSSTSKHRSTNVKKNDSNLITYTVGPIADPEITTFIMYGDNVVTKKCSTTASSEDHMPHCKGIQIAQQSGMQTDVSTRLGPRISVESKSTLLPSAVGKSTLPPNVVSNILPPSVVGNAILPSSAVGSAILPPSIVGKSTLPPSVVSNILPPSVVGNGILPSSAVGSAILPPSAVGSAILPPSVVGNVILPPSVVGSAILSPSAVSSAILPTSEVGMSTLPPSAVSNAVLPPSEVGSAILQPSAVSMSTLTPNAVGRYTLIPLLSAEGSAILLPSAVSRYALAPSTANSVTHIPNTADSVTYVTHTAHSVRHAPNTTGSVALAPNTIDSVAYPNTVGSVAYAPNTIDSVAYATHIEGSVLSSTHTEGSILSSTHTEGSAIFALSRTDSVTLTSSTAGSVTLAPKTIDSVAYATHTAGSVRPAPNTADSVRPAPNTASELIVLSSIENQVENNLRNSMGLTLVSMTSSLDSGDASEMSNVKITGMDSNTHVTKIDSVMLPIETKLCESLSKSYVIGNSIHCSQTLHNSGAEDMVGMNEICKDMEIIDENVCVSSIKDEPLCDSYQDSSLDNGDIKPYVNQTCTCEADISCSMISDEGKRMEDEPIFTSNESNSQESLAQADLETDTNKSEPVATSHTESPIIITPKLKVHVLIDLDDNMLPVGLAIPSILNVGDLDWLRQDLLTVVSKATSCLLDCIMISNIVYYEFHSCQRTPKLIKNNADLTCAISYHKRTRSMVKFGVQWEKVLWTSHTHDMVPVTKHFDMAKKRKTDDLKETI